MPTRRRGSGAATLSRAGLGWHPCRRGYRVSVVLVTPCAHRGWRGTDGFRLVALVLRAERDMRKVFRTLVARNVILISHCRLFAREQPAFPGYFDHSREMFMAEAKTNTTSPDRSSLPAIGYSLLLAAL